MDKKVLEFIRYISNNNSIISYVPARPIEITRLRVGDIDFENSVIRLKESITKNKKPRFCTIGDDLLFNLRKWVTPFPDSFYLFGLNKKNNCSKTPIGPQNFQKKFRTVKEKIKLRKSLQIYSLRDTGIIELLNQKVPPQEICKQAGHSDLSILSIYAIHVNNVASKAILDAVNKK